MAFSKQTVKFSLKDVGSEIIDQLSTDVYTGAGAILRELVKNAYDSYLHYTPDDLDDEGIKREILISRERDEKGIGRIWIADHGIGLNVKGLKAFAQISVCNKDELENSTGFRGLGSWSVLGGGSKIVITSKKKGHPPCRLTINVRKVYQKLSPSTTLDDILNDNACIYFEEEEASVQEHGTVVEIQCDGPATEVNGYELNRLYPYTDPNNADLRDLVIRYCPLPFSADQTQVTELYAKIGYVPTTVMLDSDVLERRLPSELASFSPKEITVGDTIAAVTWVAENPNQSSEVNKHINEDKHLLGGPGVQLLKFNVPIGMKGLFAKDIRQTILNWYVGEVHILSPDVLPDASGDDLRAGSAREIFIEKLRVFYEHLEKQAEVKSQRLSMLRKLKQGKTAAEQLATGNLNKAAKVEAENRVLKAVEVIQESTKRSGESLTNQQLREAASDPQVKSLRQSVRTQLKQAGYLDDFSAKKTAYKTKPRTQTNTERATAPESYIAVDEIQARIGRALPRFEEAGLTPEQIQQVMLILNDIMSSESLAAKA